MVAVFWGNYLVPMAIIADHQLAPWLQSVEELAEKLLLVSYMENCVPAAMHHDVISLIVEGLFFYL